jgi:O-antigen/teichoic acid export membrane protein
MSIRRFDNLNFRFLKDSFLNAFAVFVKLLSVYVTNKLISVYLGLAGFGLFSQMQSYFTILQGIVTAPVGLALVKQCSIANSDENKLVRSWTTSLILSLGISLFLSLFTIIFSSYISTYLFGDDSYSVQIKFISIFLYSLSINTFLLSILNSAGSSLKYSLISFISSLIIIIISSALIFFLKQNGAFYSIIIPPFVVSIITIIYVRKLKILSSNYVIRSSDFDKLIAFNILKTTVATIAITVLGLVAQIHLRKSILGLLTWQEVGVWDAINKFSFFYLILFNSIIQLHFFPIFAKTKISENRLISINGLGKAFKTTYFLVILTFLIFMLLKDFVVTFLFSSKFVEIGSLIPIQMIADFFKIGGFILGNYMLSQSFYKHFILIEVLFTLVYFFFGIILIEKFGILGLCYADIIKSSSYLIFLVSIIYFKNKKYILG